MTARIGIVTSEGWERLNDDELLAEGPLRARGIETEPVRWDREAGWDSYDALIVRSTWDYFDRPDEFAAWIDERERTGPPTWNPPSVLRWNMRKDYLRELAAAGVPVVETEWLPRGSEAIEDVMERRGWDRAVVKPTVSGGAMRTHLIRRGEPLPPDADARAAGYDLMVQPFVAQVVDEGEWSFIFFGGSFSGAILKRAASGDYRVQERHGGTTTHVPDPPATLIDQAAAAMSHAPGDLLYARVDGVRDGDRLVLIELEVLEPVLFFGVVPGSAERFADALAARVPGATHPAR